MQCIPSKGLLYIVQVTVLFIIWKRVIGKIVMFVSKVKIWVSISMFFEKNFNEDFSLVALFFAIPSTL